jgi:hypothetical protein
MNYHVSKINALKFEARNERLAHEIRDFFRGCLYPPFVSSTPKNATESGKIGPWQNVAHGGQMPLAFEA